jgi:cellulose binding protein with CBM2 domain
LPGKHNTVIPLRRYGFIAGAATLLVVLVSWVAVRAVGPAEPERSPLMVQPPVALAAGDPSPTPSPSASSSPSPSPSLSPSRSASASPSPSRTSATPRTTTIKPKPRKTTPAPPAAAFTGRYATGGSWDRGFIGAISVTNKTGPARTWTVRLTFDDDAGVRFGNVWNAKLTRDGDTFVLTGGPLAPGAQAMTGFEASKQVRGRIQPTSCTVDGATCIPE